MSVTATEDALQAFLEALPEEHRLNARTLAHAWSAAGGGLAVGRLAVRLTGDDQGTMFTAATLHAPRGEATTRLEIARVLLQSHGVAEDAFTHWADEIADLPFDPSQKFPTIPLAGLDPTQLVRLVTAVRDLAKLAGQ